LRLAGREADRLRDRYDALAMDVHAPVRPQPWPPLPRCRDADDQKFLELACAGNASVLLTRDDALLSLRRRTLRAGLFRICSPGAYDPHDQSVAEPS
jgi:predicted nucleic acid-binding protein